MHFKRHHHNRKKWTIRQKTTLALALLGCSVMAEHDKRKSVVDELPVEIRTNVKQIGVDRHDVLNIVSTCIQHRGGIEELVDIIKFFEPNSIGYENLEETVEEILTPGIIIKKELRDELLEILSGVIVDKKILINLYRECLPFRVPIESQADTLRRILPHLAKLSRQEGAAFPYPILKFVVRLAFVIDQGKIREQIDAWIKKWANELDLSTDEVVSLSEHLKSKSTSSYPQKKLYLLIELEPKVEDKYREIGEQTRYVVNVWLLDDKNETEVGLPNDFYMLADMANLLDELLNNLILKEREVADDNLTIEFLLPDNLLYSYAVEHEPLLRHKQKLPIGCRYQVVVRPRERVSSYRRWAPIRWQKHWKKIKNSSALVLQQTPVWSGRLEGRLLRELYSQMEQQPILVCVLMSSASSSNIDHDTQTILDMIRDEGTPIALWTRQAHSNPQQIRKDFEKMLLKLDQVERLCELVREERKKAWIKKPHEPYIALLWDDPTRVPSSLRQLSAPQHER